MDVTKYEHACVVLSKEGGSLVIDPGGFTRGLGFLRDVVGVVITHQHPDHWSQGHIEEILQGNPGARLLGPEGVAYALGEVGFTVETVGDGDTATVGPFSLRFAGTDHAVIHESLPRVDNTGVLVDDTLFHPGDSYTVPPFPVPVLAAPIGAPWLKIGEAIDYAAAVKPGKAFPIHETTLSETGLAMHTDRIRAAVGAAGGEYVVLAPGETLSL